MDRCLEKLIGPVLGHHLACYTVPGPDGHVGYAKVCSGAPLDVWDTPQAIVKVAAGPFADPEAALVAVVSRARRRLERRAAGWVDEDDAAAFVLLGP